MKLQTLAAVFATAAALTTACGIDPNGIWKVQPVSAQITADNSGSPWDLDNSAPDVFAALTCPGSPSTSTNTPSVESNSPTWTTGGCTAKAGDLLAQKFTVQLFDSDLVSNETITGVLTPDSLTEAQFVAGSITFGASGGMTSLVIDLEEQ